jgi:2-polyprenyl-3-methyl-5-hydroxy-6-metoxy-1,4-benzoquinol methylase
LFNHGLIWGDVMEQTSSDLDHLRWLSDLGLSATNNISLLDVGCGSGYICHKAMEDGAKTAVGIDMVRPKGLTDRSSWRFMSLDLNASDWTKEFHEERFDRILAFDILEHLDSPYLFLKNLRSVMSPSAHLVLTTPNLMSWERYARPQNWSGVRDEQHKTLFTRYSLKFLLSKVGLKASLIKAPMRSLGGLRPWTPQIGGQIICVAQPR